MNEINKTTWRELTGNKFVVGLHTAMLSESGYIKQQCIRKTGDTNPSLFNVKYDSDYLSQFIIRKFVKPLSVLGRERFNELVNNAWDLYDKELLTPQGLSKSNN